MIEVEKVGIFNKGAYYADEEESRKRRVTIAQSIYYDRMYMAQKVLGGFDPKQLQTFLIGGCFAAESVDAMTGYIQRDR